MNILRKGVFMFHSKTKVILSFLIVFVLFLTSGSLSKGFLDMKEDITEFTLDNGLKFIVMERHSAPVVSFHVHADVGSVNETYGITGISHLLEHMAFKGSKTVGTKNHQQEKIFLNQLDSIYTLINDEKFSLSPDSARIAQLENDFEEIRLKAKELVINNEFIDLLQSEGDNETNAYTSYDGTHYISSLPSNKLEFWMSIASDRFLNPVFREFYKEKDVVIEERRMRTENQPIGKLLEDFMGTAFKAHPYHHPIVGHIADLYEITRQDVEDYFNTYYCPNNLTIAIVGDVKSQEVKKMAETYFGRIPRGEDPPRVRTKEPEQWGERIVKVEAQSQPVVILGYHRPDVNHQDDAALNALANIIGQGKSSRLYTQMVKEKKIAIQTGAFNGWPGDKFPNLIAFYAFPAQGKTAEECLEVINQEIDHIKNELVSEEELIKFKNSTKMQLIGQMKSNSQMATLLAYTDVVNGDWEKVFTLLDEIDQLKAEDIKEVANRYLMTKNRTIGQIVNQEIQ